MSAVSKTTLVAGLGKPGFCDEAIGLHVVQALKAADLPEYVELFEGSEASDLTELFAGREQIIVIDAADFNGLPGQFVELQAPDLVSDQTNVLHHADIRRTMAVLFLRDSIPRDLTILAVIPACSQPGSELSDEVRRRVPEVVNAILERIRSSRS